MLTLVDRYAEAPETDCLTPGRNVGGHIGQRHHERARVQLAAKIPWLGWKGWLGRRGWFGDSHGFGRYSCSNSRNRVRRGMVPT